MFRELQHQAIPYSRTAGYRKSLCTYQDFVKRTAGTASISHNTRTVSTKSRQLKPYMNRIIRRRYQLSSIPFFYPEDGDIILLLNVCKFLRYIREDNLLYLVPYCLQMGLPPNELSVPIQGTSIFPFV